MPIDVMALDMPKRKSEMMEEELPEMEMEEMEDEEDELSEESPLAGFSDEELLDEVKARGLV